MYHCMPFLQANIKTYYAMKETAKKVRSTAGEGGSYPPIPGGPRSQPGLPPPPPDMAASEQEACVRYGQKPDALRLGTR